MKVFEDKNFLNQQHKDSISNILKGGDVPFYMSLEAAKPGDGGVNFVHHIVHRDNPGQKNSKLYGLFVDILNTFCSKNNIEYKNIHRCAINITINSGLEKCPIHTDHIFPHKQLLIYLNESDGDTVILKSDEVEVVSVCKPEIYKGIVFDRLPHYHYFPTKGIRAVAIITFS
jgi:hypothetical protein